MARIAVVTGGAQGIGRATLARLRAEGWRVAALDLDAEALGEIEGEGVLAIEADAGCEDAVARAFRAIEAWRGGDALALLVNNAAIADPVTGPVERLSLAEWRRRLDASLTAAFLCSRAAIPALRAARGAIVNIASTRAVQSEPDCEAYAASKGGVVALTHAMAISLGPAIRVNAVAPGWIDVRAHAKAAAREADDLRGIDHAQHPGGRVGRPEDVAAAVLWLAGDQAGFVTGQVLTLDGGMGRRMIYAE
ncbi:MAG: SDR family oxidoreductase [Paracoccaceae bacterium]